PQARLVTTFMGMGILSIEYPITPDRVFLLNPGQTLDLGDRTIKAFRPPVFDSPATTGFHDSRTGSCFTSDCFGAPVATAETADVEDVRDIPVDDLVAAQRLWVTVDSPWVAGVDRDRFAASLEPLRALDPAVVLSTHLPPARRAMPALLDMLDSAPDAEPFVGPDQAVLEQLLAGFAPQPA
ncbi:MAG TPA: MBL fold metallo-hydrolase, partial [Mycobacteriales bacterium]|nr:MBL fold metallo-hydrolase [Mycobacteriales bacterium]